MIVVEEYFFLNLTVLFYFILITKEQLNYRIEPLGKDRDFLFI